MARFLRGHPLDLAVFRVVVFTVVLGSPDLHGAWRWAGLPLTARHSPLGWDWLLRAWPPALEPARIVYAIFLLAAVFALVGLFTRVATIVAALTGAWLLGLPQMSGQVLHTHHLVWFLFLLAASPCGDRLSIDALRRARKGQVPPGEAIEYGLPLRIAWVSVGLLFFFAGFWKLEAGGLGWGDGLARQVEFKALQTGVAPLVRIDRPELLGIAGLLAIGFELSVGGLLLWKRTRLLQLPPALAEPVPSRRWIPAGLIGAGLLGLQLLTGVLGEEQSWPVACYPTFRHAPPEQLAWIEADEQLAGGIRPALTLEQLRGADGQRWWGVGWRVLRNPTPEALAAHYRARQGEPGSNVRAVGFYRVTPASRTLLWSWRLR